MTTRWTLIIAARSDDEQAREALTNLCQAYWRPVYAYIRRNGRTPEQAADLTQSFFLHILEHRGFARADPGRGRFRSFLLTSARNFLANAREHDLAERRGGGAPHDPIDLAATERHLALETSDPLASPEAAFERQWAIRIAERAIEQLGRDYAARGQRAIFEQLHPLLTSDIVPSGSGSPPAAPGDQSDAAARTALHRLRKRFGEALRAEIESTVGDGADVDDELRHLLRILGD
jgi:DNA-directed RNA polymerase specialized sigma24 family protein